MMSGIKRGRLSAEEDQRVVRLAARGFKPGRVALLLNRHPGTINWAFYRLGLKAPSAPKERVYVRDGRTVRHFTAEEDSYIETLRVAGHSQSAIARATSARFGTARSTHTIGTRLKMLANREAP